MSLFHPRSSLRSFVARRALAAGRAAEALRIGGEDDVALLSRLDLHLSVLARTSADEKRHAPERIAARVALGDLDALPPVEALSNAWRARLARLAAPWSCEVAVRLLPARESAARAAGLMALGEREAAAPLLARLAPDRLETRALTYMVACGGADAAERIAAFAALFEGDGLRPPDVDGPIRVATLRGTAPARSGPLVSVVMPARDAAATVAGAVRAILDQSHRDLELLLVDDGSRDGTATVALEAAAGDARLRVIRRDEPGGPYVARNAALRSARGRLVAFNDADDWSHPHRIAAAVERLRDDAVVAVLSDMMRMDEEGRPVAQRRFPLVRMNPSSLVVRREAVDRAGGFDEVPTGADSEYIARLITLHGPGAVVRDRRLLAITALRRGSLSHGSETAIEHREGARRRIAYREDWMRRHAALPPIREVFAPR